MNDDDVSELLRFFGSDGIEMDMGMRDDVRQIKAEIAEIARKGGYLSHRDARILRELEAELESIQSKCHHNWELVTLFTFTRQFCSRCDLENKSYRHVK
jgi:hypothetical protein